MRPRALGCMRITDPVVIAAALDAGVTILDPYAGSGSTLMAAKAAGRRAIGVEIVEEYCERAARRCAQETLGLSA